MSTTPASVVPIVSDELATFLGEGLSIALGTRDAALAPEGARIWAVRLDDDRSHLEAFAYAGGVGPTLANLEANGLMAVVFDRPYDHTACQLKGVFTGWRPARDDERAFVEEHFENLCRTLELIGLPRALYGPSCRIWPAVALRMRITDAFRQTPGPGAGERMP
ncbi:MAG: hypothetical protein U1F43_38625 [Myxococcota bacterium]